MTTAKSSVHVRETMKRTCTISLFCALAATAAGAATFTVDSAAAAGGDGSAAKPWRTVQDAVLGVRAARKAGAVKAGEPVEVVFRAGEHSVGVGVALGAADSGTAEAPVTWRGEGKAVLTGGVRVPSALFKKVEDPAVRARLPEEARDTVYVADVAALVPTQIPALASGFSGTPTAPLLFMGGKIATLARWPNIGFTSFKKALDKRRDAPGAFLYDNPRARRWNFAEGVWLNGYWTHDWDNFSARVAHYGEENGTNNVMRLAVKVPYGVGNTSWGLAERRFYAFNLLDELDAPGEWWLDRANKRLYIVPPAGTPREDDAVTLTFLTAPLVTAQGVKHMRFETLMFEGGVGSGMSVNGNNVAIENCRFACLGAAGLNVNGNSNLVRGVEVCETGRSGIGVTSGDRRTLMRGNTLIEDCHIHDWAHFQRTYAPAIGVGGCGVTLRRNRMHDAPHAAVLYGGNEHLFEYNDVWRVLMETGDAGAYYTGRDWTTQGNVLRYNYTHDLGSGAGDAANTMGFYFDDCDCGDAVYGNIFHNVARGIMVGGGRDHPIYNNVFSKCKVGLSIDCRGMTWKNWNQPGDGWHLEGKALAFNYTNGVWAARYPRLARIMQDHPKEPLYNPVTGNLFLDCTQQILALDGKAADECLPRMAPITGNIVVNTVGTNGVRTAGVDRRIAAGFRVFNGTPEQPFAVGFTDAAHGDFTFTRDAWILQQIPALRPLLDWFPLTKHGASVR